MTATSRSWFVRTLNNEVAVEAIVGDGAWLGELRRELFALLAGVFAQARSRLAAFAYIEALLAEPGDRRSCWQLAEAAGHATPRRMQALLAEHRWDWTAALKALQRFIVAFLGDPGAILAIDETAELKKGTATVGVARQYAGITGQVENCQTVVFAAYVTARGHAPFDFRLYLPKSWFRGRARRDRARVPARTRFAAKPALAAAMVTAAARARVLFSWVAGDEVCGRSGRLRQACEKGRQGVRARGPGELRRQASLRPQGGRVLRRRDGAGRGVGDPLVRARLQGPPGLPVGVGRDRLAAALAAGPPQPRRPR